MHWTEDYRLKEEGGLLRFFHEPTQKVLLITENVSMETLNSLMVEFDTFGYIRPNWRDNRIDHRDMAQRDNLK